MKVILCALFIVLERDFNQLKGWTVTVCVKAAAVPAVIYAFQNQLMQLAYRNIDGLTFNLVNQSKTLFTALCLYLLMGAKQSGMQLVALFMLVGRFLGMLIG